MNEEQEQLWKKLVAFDFDRPMTEYSFTVRLAAENKWTEGFTAKALMEYRKFMFLAAISDEMVSPSGPVDAVWHQHLVFTHSYRKFCNILGKDIQHVPSLHKETDFRRFRDAKARTKELYEANFGPQPEAHWNFDGMLESLSLPKAKWKLGSVIIVAFLAFPILLIPFYYLLKPVYFGIKGTDFIWAFTLLTTTAVIILEFTNRYYLERTLHTINRESFIFRLTPFELLYLQSVNLRTPIIAAINNLCHANYVEVHAKSGYVYRTSTARWNNKEEYQVLKTIGRKKNFTTNRLLGELLTKPIFHNNASCMTAFRKYFNKSSRFAAIFQVNLAVFGVLLLFGSTRLITGIEREKPVGYLILTLFLFTCLATYFLVRLSKQVNFHTIPRYYREWLTPSNTLDKDWAWLYFMNGDIALAAMLLPVFRNSSGGPDTNTTGGGCGATGGGSGDAGSCGSSCGSGDGGGGCGGCGMEIHLF